MSEPASAIPAATVVPLRDGPDGLEALLLRRSADLTSFGGVWVFPGGRIDEDDGSGTIDELDAARRAAVREAHEEAGLRLDPDDLVHLSHWSPPPRAGRRFATWFFLAAAGGQEVRIDEGEVHEHRWYSPAAALARLSRMTNTAPPPGAFKHSISPPNCRTMP